MGWPLFWKRINPSDIFTLRCAKWRRTFLCASRSVRAFPRHTFSSFSSSCFQLSTLHLFVYLCVYLYIYLSKACSPAPSASISCISACVPRSHCLSLFIRTTVSVLLSPQPSLAIMPTFRIGARAWEACGRHLKKKWIKKKGYKHASP